MKHASNKKYRHQDDVPIKERNSKSSFMSGKRNFEYSYQHISESSYDDEVYSNADENSDFLTRSTRIISVIAIISLIIIFVIAHGANEEDIDMLLVYSTGKNNDLFVDYTLKPDASVASVISKNMNVNSLAISTGYLSVDSSVSYQTILGFGGAFTEATALNFFKLPPHERTKFMEMYFGKDGANFNMGRIHINSCDFSPESYNFDNYENDFDLEYFDMNVKHDKKAILPLLQLALRQARRGTDGIRLVASPWSPPGWMKRPEGNVSDYVQGMRGEDYNEMNMLGSAAGSCLIHDDKVLTAWAKYISKFIEAYKSNGVRIWAITPQNEPEFAAPWEACLYNSTYEKYFIQKYLGPTLREDHDGIKILAFDHNKESLEHWTDVMFKNNSDLVTSSTGYMSEILNYSFEYVDGMAFHWYTASHDGNIRMVDGAFGHDAVYNSYRIEQEAFEDQEDKWFSSHRHSPILLATEGCSCAGVFWNDWARAERAGHDILSDLNAYTQGYIIWNMLVDERGGPNHLHNYCDAPLIMKQKKKGSGYMVHVQPTYHYIRHFSRFLTPDVSTRIESKIIGNYGYVECDPHMATGIELALHSCERSSRQMWMFNEFGEIEMKVPSRAVPYDPYTGSGGPTLLISETRRHCVHIGGGSYWNGLRPMLKLGRCTSDSKREEDDESSPLRFIYNSSTLQLQFVEPVNGITHENQLCVQTKPSTMSQGFLLQAAPCASSLNSGDILHSQQFTVSEKGEIMQSSKVAESPLCVTAGWPFLNAVAFADVSKETNNRKNTVIVMNEADLNISIALVDTLWWGPYSIQSGNHKPRSHPTKAYSITALARSILTLIYETDVTS